MISTKSIPWSKIRRRLRSIWVQKTKHKTFYPKIYLSYWHYKLSNKNPTERQQQNYFSIAPNPGAGIGHQIANWIAGVWFAKQFGLKFAYLPFSNSEWDNFLGLGEDEKWVNNLTKTEGYKKITLPLFKEYNEKEISLIRKIIQSYGDEKIVFVAEEDQFHASQHGVMQTFQQKFYQSRARTNDSLLYDNRYYNIAIHVRRGDISLADPKLSLRWQTNSYFKNVLEQVLANLEVNRPFAIYLFSQGESTDFEDFTSNKNLRLCLEMNAQESFLHMVMADLLITSKSSFSYKPALLNRGIKISPKNFWHGYPETDDWVLVDDDGNFDTTKLTRFT